MKSMIEMALQMDVRGVKRAGLALIAAFGMVTAPAMAQVETFDPDEAYPTQQQQSASPGIDADLASPGAATAQPKVPMPVDQWEPPEGADTADSGFDEEFSDLATDSGADTGAQTDWAVDGAGPAVTNAGPYGASTAVPVGGQDAPAEQVANSDTYGQDDLIGAAEGVFGKGAEGLAGLIEDLLRKQGEPNGYIVGREAGGAFVVGARYGSGTLHHKVEGERKVYWTGPSIGFDAGASAGSSFVLVYNLYDTQDLFKRFPAGEGQAYFIGGLHVSYLRRGDIVLIPIRVGAGLRLGVNAGYMRFSEKQRWLPF